MAAPPAPPCTLRWEAYPPPSTDGDADPAAPLAALAASVGGPGQALGALAGLPCGKCPVARECVDGGAVSPQACAYLSRFLDF